MLKDYLHKNSVEKVTEFEAVKSCDGNADSCDSNANLCDSNANLCDNNADLYDSNVEERPFYIILSPNEKVLCLKEILDKLKKVLYVYDKSKDPESNYNYRVFCGGILIYISSCNSLFDGELVNVIVNLKSIVDNELEKPQVKRIVFDCRHDIEDLIKKYEK